MNTANLEILGLSFPIGDAKFHDEGFVDSIFDFTDKLIEKNGYNPEPFKKLKDYRSTVALYLQSGLNHHIFYLDYSPKVNIHLRAHEETHVLESFGRLDLLVDKLLDEQKVMIDFDNIDDREVRASIGSLYALYARGISPWKLYWLDDFSSTSLDKARKIYRKSKLAGRKFFSLIS